MLLMRISIFRFISLLQSLRDVDYVVKEKLFLERLLEIEFYDAVDRSLFYQGEDSALLL